MMSVMSSTMRSMIAAAPGLVRVASLPGLDTMDLLFLPLMGFGCVTIRSSDSMPA